MPEYYRRVTSSGFEVPNEDVLTSIPGTKNFSPVQWVIQAEVSSQLTLTTPGQLVTFGAKMTESYVIYNVFVLSVAPANPFRELNSTLGIVDASVLVRLDDTVLMSS
jgi:hypothetical protein